MQKVYIIAEAGINHNGNINIAKGLIDVAADAGADAIKFQKRDIETVYSKEVLDSPRKSPWGTTTREQKEGLEFSYDDYFKIFEYAKVAGIDCFASCWDVKSQHGMVQFYSKYNKVASAMLGHAELLKEIAHEKKHTFISTGMATMPEIHTAYAIFKEWDCPFELMHCNSTYPLRNLEDVNLNCIQFLKRSFGCDVGYSGHEVGLAVTLAATALGATSIERHITLDRTMYGSDQSSSIEPGGFKRLVRDIRAIEKALGLPTKHITKSEEAVRKKLRYYA